MIVDQKTTHPASQSKPSVKRRIARRAQQLLYLSGIAGLYAQLQKAERTLILMYHSVVDETIAPFVDPNNSITIKQFESHLNMLHKSSRVISLAELIFCLRENKPISPNTVVITFDDGYLDNLVNAAPLLDKYQMPATLFLATGYIESGEPQWVDSLYNLFKFRSRHELALKNADLFFDLKDRVQSTQAYRSIKKMLRTTGFQERKKLLGLIEEQVKPTTFPPRLTLNWDDVRHLKDKFPLFEIGVHTRSHTDLTTIKDKQIEYEISQSRDDYVKELGCEPRLFSYPYGRHDPNIRSHVKNAAFLGAVGTQPTCRIDLATDQFALPRLACPQSLLDLKVWLSGAFPELSISLWGKASD